MLSVGSRIPPTLIDELTRALEIVKSYGSIELYVQDGVVTQITVRNIRKTKLEIKDNKKK